MPLLGEDVTRLINERPATPWEFLIPGGCTRAEADPARVHWLCNALRGSPRVKQSVKEKSDEELLAHYHLTRRRTSPTSACSWSGPPGSGA